MICTQMAMCFVLQHFVEGPLIYMACSPYTEGKLLKFCKKHVCFVKPVNVLLIGIMVGAAVPCTVKLELLPEQGYWGDHALFLCSRSYYSVECFPSLNGFFPNRIFLIVKLDSCSIESAASNALGNVGDFCNAQDGIEELVYLKKTSLPQNFL